MTRPPAPHRSRQRALWSALTAFALLPAALSAQGLRVEAAAPQQRDAEPGERQTVVFLVHNDGAGIVPATLTVAPPPGWSTLILSDATVRLGPGVSEAVPVMVAVPADAEGGRHVIMFSAGTGTGDVASDSAVLVVGTVRRVLIEPLAAPSIVLPGTDYEARFLVANRGNRTESVALSVDAPGDVTAAFGPASLELGPGEARDVVVRLRATRESRGSGVRTVTLHARATGPDGVAARHALRFELTRPGEGGVRPVLPAELTLRAAGHNDGGPAIGFRAGGRVAGATVNAIVRTAPRDYSMFGGTDQYRLTVESSRFSLLLGDDTFRESPLVAAGSRRTGARLGVRLGQFEIGGAVHGNRLTGSLTDDLLRTASLSWRPAGWLRASASYMETPRTGTTGVHGANIRISPLRNTEADVHLARSAGGGDAAVDARLQTRVGRLSADALMIRNPDDFVAGHRGFSREHGSATLRLGRGVTAGGAAERTRHSGAASFEPMTGKEARTASAFLRTSFGGIDYRNVQTLRSSVPGAVVLDAVRVQGRTGSGALRLRSTVEHGRIQAADTTGDYTRAGVDADLTYRALLLRLGGSWQQGMDWASLTERAVRSATAGIEIGRQGGTRLAVRGTVHEHGLAANALFSADATWEQPVMYGHRLVLRARVSGSVDQVPHAIPSDRTGVRLSYEIPIRVPVGREPGFRVTGRAYDASTGVGIGNMLVSIGGRAALTDRDGYFEVRGVSSGRHAVNLDAAATVDAYSIWTTSTIDVDDRDTHLDLALEQRAAITGSVRRWGPPATVGSTVLNAVDRARLDGADAGSAVTAVALLTDQDSFVDLGPGAGATLEARCDGDVYRAVTDALGNYRLAGMRPGRCTLTVVRVQMPRHHVLEQSDIDVQVQGGATETAHFRVIPQARRIEMVAEIDVRVESP